MAPFSTMLHGGGIELRGDLDPIHFEPSAGLSNDQEQPNCFLIVAIVEHELPGRLAGPGW
jgi:hypothetical protein